MTTKHTHDPVLFWTAILIISIGFIVVTSASMSVSVLRFGHAFYYSTHQLVLGIVPGVIALILALNIPYTYLKKIALPLLIISVALTAAVFIPQLSLVHGGAKRWILLGAISFQPSEFLKFAFVVYLSAWLSNRSKEVQTFTFGLLPFVIMSAIIAVLLIFQPDIGTLIVLLVTAGVLFFLRGGNLKHIFLSGLIGLILLSGLAVLEPYRLNRIKVFFNPSEDKQGIGYQINQASIAIGSGGLWGRGLGLSRQKFSYLPEPMGDSIFAVAAEELGFLGSTGIIGLFLFFFFRGIVIIQRVPDLFGQIMGTGFLFIIIFQAFVNMAAIIGLIPLTGIPLSLISYGGTALAVMMLEIGIVLNISKSRIIS
jgi:cell division protein FtsW